MSEYEGNCPNCRAEVVLDYYDDLGLRCCQNCGLSGGWNKEYTEDYSDSWLEWSWDRQPRNIEGE